MADPHLEDRKREDRLDTYFSVQYAKADQVAEEIGYDWLDDARCAGEDPELWQPDRTRSRERDARTREAVNLCFNECPVRLQCLKASCIFQEPTGIWGGLPLGIRKGTKGTKSFDYEALSKLPNPYE
jgi:hypothetical protein